jgi:hypothetical protein
LDGRRADTLDIQVSLATFTADEQTSVERKKTMALHTAKTSVERISDSDPTPTLINFGFEITDGELKSISAWDEQGRNYTVSIKLTNAQPDDVCCCPTPTGVKCLKAAQCNCNPV